MYVKPGNDASQWTGDLWSKAVLLLWAYLWFFFGFDNYFLFNFFGFFAPAYCGPVYSSVNEPTVDNGGGSVTVAVGVSDMWQVTALHRGLSKYLTAQDTHITPTIIKQNRTLARLGNLLSLQPQSTIQINRAFYVPSFE